MSAMWRGAARPGIRAGGSDNEGPFPDWFYWQEYVFDLTGTQVSESRLFVELLSEMIRAPVIPPNRP